MSNPFLTVEDINSTVYNNQDYWWYEIDTSKLPDTNFTDVKYDFCTISMEQDEGGGPYIYHLEINNGLWTKGGYVLQNNGEIASGQPQYYEGVLYVTLEQEEVPGKIRLYMGPQEFSGGRFVPLDAILTDGYVLNLNYKELNTTQELPIKILSTNISIGISVDLVKGYNELSTRTTPRVDYDIGFLLVNLVKSDFKFNCNQSLKLGQVNTVALGTHTDYKPNGDMIGTYTPTIKILYNDETITAEYDTDDYYFTLDLTDVTEPSKVKFKVIVEANDVINHTETEVTLDADYGLISNRTELTNLCTNGGIGKLGTDITLTSDLTVSKDTVLIAEDKTIGFDEHKLIVANNTLLKMEGITLNGGVNTITQKKGSRLELTDTTFTECTGLGSCIKCDIDLDSLDNPNDYITILTGCTFTDNETAILHGGELTINDCNFSITNEDYLSSTNPSFLYLTDGEANITGSTFDITVNDTINYDLMFAPAIFTIGETAVINGRNHDEWGNNNQTGFLGLPYNNRSSISLTYLYDLISANVTLSSSNGYCHSVSGEDYLFKTNITLTRSE